METRSRHDHRIPPTGTLKNRVAARELAATSYVFAGNISNINGNVHPVKDGEGTTIPLTNMAFLEFQSDSPLRSACGVEEMFPGTGRTPKPELNGTSNGSRL